MTYPLLADFTKQVSKDYGVLLERLGAALRGTFLIDPDGLLRACSVQDLTVGRNVDEILRLVSALKTGELCPVGWRPGGTTCLPCRKTPSSEGRRARVTHAAAFTSVIPAAACHARRDS